MAIVAHGEWEYYTPPPNEDLPSSIMFARRIADGQDWYEYVAGQPFSDGGVVMTVQHTDTGDIVQAATRDPSAIFPANMIVIEETEYSGNAPQTEFGRRTYSAELRKIT
jgi:hypothetical protein